MAEHGLPRDHPPVLALVQDGIGMGPDGTLRGAELLLCDYAAARRLASLRPAALPGGDHAAMQPWRNLLARLAQIGAPQDWPEPLALGLAHHPAVALHAAIIAGVNAPVALPAGRLLDAVAAAAGICADRQTYEGDAAMLLQACAERHLRQNRAAPGYAFATDNGPDGLHLTDPAPLWPQIAADIDSGATPGRIAARFHAGWAAVWADAVIGFAGSHGVGKIFRSGGGHIDAAPAGRVVMRSLFGGDRLVGRLEGEQLPQTCGTAVRNRSVGGVGTWQGSGMACAGWCP